MTATLAHRGPEGSAAWISSDSTVGLGHTRLAIIDLSTGSQPMLSATGRYLITFNGEIYNYRALRVELEARGHVFRTNSDTEVILEAYDEWSYECTTRFRGMFAFAVYDTHSHELFMARDATGIKPLYYYTGPEGLFFASELKALLQVPSIPRRLNYSGLLDYVVLGYTVHPRTAFAGIAELSPGSWLRSSREGLVSGRFWNWRRRAEHWDRRQAVDRMTAALYESLADHIVADVPIGAFLSGGIDSSLLTALLSKQMNESLQTFHVRFDGDDYDESYHAAVVAARFGTKHIELSVSKCNSRVDLVHSVLDHFDQPFADSSAIPTYLLCREMKQHVKVAIAGDGGDEMFGGYPRFGYCDIAKYLGMLPGPLIRSLNRRSHFAADHLSTFGRVARRISEAAVSVGNGRLLALSSYVYPSDLATVLRPEVIQQVNQYIPNISSGDCGPSGPDGADFIDSTIQYALPGDYLKKVDMMSSAHGFEVRVPFLGQQVLACASRVPTYLQYSAFRSKRLLRTIAAEHLPPSIIHRSKHGFGIPLDTWLGTEGRTAVRDMLGQSAARINELILPAYTSRLLSAFATGEHAMIGLSRFGLYQRVYALWSLERWLLRWNPSL